MRRFSLARSDAVVSASAPPARAVEAVAADTTPAIGETSDTETPEGALPAAPATTASTSGAAIPAAIETSAVDRYSTAPAPRQIEPATITVPVVPVTANVPVARTAASGSMPYSAPWSTSSSRSAVAVNRWRLIQSRYP